MSDRKHGTKAKLRQRAFARWGFVPRAPHFRWGRRFVSTGHGESGFWWMHRVPGSVIYAILLALNGHLWMTSGGPFRFGSGLAAFVIAPVVLMVSFACVAHALYWRILLRSTPRVYSALAVPTCYRCGFDLAGILTDEPRARVVCPECGQRQLRCRIPQDRPVVWKAPKEPFIPRPVTPAQPLVPRPARDVAASKPLPPGVVVRVIKDEPVEVHSPRP
ncbi:MAG: hypothetical protein SFY95_07870 [Planctomycetota bacterium]|nr:hypothetical protein [Planctomycetota bacterium]